MILAGTILDLLFGWGMARGDGVRVRFQCFRLVFSVCHSSQRWLFPPEAFHAQQDMKTPLRASYHAVVVNLVLSVLLGLILPFGIKGLAAAGVFASAWQCFFLWKRSGIPSRSGCQLDKSDSRCWDYGCDMLGGLVYCLQLATP